MLRLRELGTLVTIAATAAAAACDRSATTPDRVGLRPAVPVLAVEPIDAGPEATASATFDAEGGRLDWTGERLHSSLFVPPGALGGPTFFDLHADDTQDLVHLVVRAVSVTPADDTQEDAGDEGFQLVVRNPTGADQQVEVTFVPQDGGDPTSVRTLLYAGGSRSMDIRRGRGRSKYSVIFF